MLSVGLSEKGKAKVTSVMGLPKGMSVPPQVNSSFHFSLAPDQYKETDYESLSKGFKEMVSATPEYQAIQRRKSGVTAPATSPAYEEAPSNFDSEEIPF
jgi:hypothetical protein